jgi:hypothetical protein
VYGTPVGIVHIQFDNSRLGFDSPLVHGCCQSRFFFQNFCAIILECWRWPEGDGKRGFRALTRMPKNVFGH